MAHTLETIAKELGARVEGDGSISITHASEPQSATASALALAMSEKYADGLANGR